MWGIEPWSMGLEFRELTTTQVWMCGNLIFEYEAKMFLRKIDKNNSVPSRDLSYQDRGLELTLSLVTLPEILIML